MCVSWRAAGCVLLRCAHRCYVRELHSHPKMLDWIYVVWFGFGAAITNFL